MPEKYELAKVIVTEFDFHNITKRCGDTILNEKMGIGYEPFFIIPCSDEHGNKNQYEIFLRRKVEFSIW